MRGPRKKRLELEPVDDLHRIAERHPPTRMLYLMYQWPPMVAVSGPGSNPANGVDSRR